MPVYQPRPSPRDRAATIALVVAIHAGLAFALINLSGPVRDVLPEEVVEIFDVTEPPPPPVVEQIPEPQKEQPKREEGAASPKNIETKATPVVAPKPPISLPIPVPIPVTQTPGQGSDRTQGASDVVGPGTGGGGQGTGTGSGGSGSGTGGGGGGIGRPPQLIQGNITRRDYPQELRRYPTPRGVILMEFQIGTDGRVRNCRVMQSSGNPVLDASTCRLVEQRYVYRPALDKQGRPTVITGRMSRWWWGD